METVMTETTHNPKLDENPGGNTEKPADQWVSGDDPVTGAQASYLTTLAEEAHVEVNPDEMTKAEASQAIDDLKSSLGR
jgi:hypothetical protein